MDKLKKFENKQLEKLKESKKIPNFNTGDTVIVHVKIIEKKRERTQAFEGVCIAKKNNGINSSFTVRKISYGEGVERVFPLFSPNVAKIEVKTKGKVKRAKLYYLRGLSGRKSRIIEDKTVEKKTVQDNIDKNDISKNKLEKKFEEEKTVKEKIEKSDKEAKKKMKDK
tara:strand:+ start:263 stop:766 length:504 start_codon:yes stop_codon:yes gene_type:complete